MYMYIFDTLAVGYTKKNQAGLQKFTSLHYSGGYQNFLSGPSLICSNRQFYVQIRIKNANYLTNFGL